MGAGELTTGLGSAAGPNSGRQKVSNPTPNLSTRLSHPSIILTLLGRF